MYSVLISIGYYDKFHDEMQSQGGQDPLFQLTDYGTLLKEVRTGT